jgi:hypothetical protein
MSMIAITISTWIQLPVFGKLELIFRPKKPSSHRMTRIKMIVHNMRFLLNDLLNLPLEAIRLVDRMGVDLTVQYDENSSGDGEDRQNRAQAA